MSRDERGFTLLELVIVVALTAILMVTVFGALDKVKNSEERVRQSKDYEKESYLLFHRLSGLFKNRSGFIIYTNGRAAEIFRGSGRGLVFLTRAPLLSYYRSLFLVELMFRDRRVYYRECPFRENDPSRPFSLRPLEQEPFLPLLEDVDKATFGYFGWNPHVKDFTSRDVVDCFAGDEGPDEVLMRMVYHDKTYDFSFPRGIIDETQEIPGDLFK